MVHSTTDNEHAAQIPQSASVPNAAGHTQSIQSVPVPTVETLQSVPVAAVDDHQQQPITDDAEGL